MIKNEYEYTSEACVEIISTWYNKKFGMSKKLVWVLSLISITVYIMTNSFAYLFLFATTVVFILLIRMKSNKAIKLELSRLDVLYQKERPTIRVELEEKIHVITPGSDRSIEYSDVGKVMLSKHFIILSVKGYMTIGLKKDGFIQGTEEECMALLNQKYSKK